jgi:hypothetical protein
MTVYRDPLFPMTPPPFLFAHQVSIVRSSQVTLDTTESGWPVFPSNTPVVATSAYVAHPQERTLSPDGEVVDAVILVPNGTLVDHQDVIDVPGGQHLPPQLVGRFRINQVRPNASHTRVLASRVTDPAGAEA